MISFEKLERGNFNMYSLDKFNRYQETLVNLRCVNGSYVYVDEPFVETWDATQLREKAQNVLNAIEIGCIGFIAKSNNQVVGFAYLGHKILGSEKQYIDLIMFHVSNEFRNKGIGKILFNLICDEARKLPVKKIYISANSAKETQEAYRALGCIFASEIQEEIAIHEPLDIQLEYIL
ncbi:hypothetical protein AN644_03490 [Candidatus Epulonipiscium fishelsonii]|nr:hypothetical protein AN644_03490 [Epulopiscium sp. SCG-C06WGA-EpuloA1]